MSLSRQFRDLRRKLADLKGGLEAKAPREPRANRWNTIGRTRLRLAEILTTYVRSIQGRGGGSRYQDAQVLPSNIKAMRLVGKARLWQDAHSWEAVATWPDGGVATTIYSFDTMTVCARAGQVHPVGKDGEVSV